MYQKGVAHIVIPTALVSLFVWFFVIGPIFEEVGNTLLNELGSNSICPEEFKTAQYRICFNTKGEVIADGQFSETTTISIDGTTNSCHVNTGNYDFQFTGCKLEKFKQLEAYNLILLTSKGRISLNGKEILNRIDYGYQIVKITPKELSWTRKLLPFIKFA